MLKGHETILDSRKLHSKPFSILFIWLVAPVNSVDMHICKKIATYGGSRIKSSRLIYIKFLWKSHHNYVGLYLTFSHLGYNNFSLSLQPSDAKSDQNGLMNLLRFAVMKKL